MALTRPAERAERGSPPASEAHPASKLRARSAAWLAERPGAYVAGIAAAYLLLGLWATRPLLAHLDRALPYGSAPAAGEPRSVTPGDSHQLLFFQWLFADNVASGRSPMANVYEFGPLDPHDLHTLGAWGFPMQLLFACLLPFGRLAAYNVILILSYPATGLAQYALLRQLGAARPAAFLGGLVLAFALPRALQMAGGHANGFLYWHLPLLLTCIWAALARSSARAALGAAVVLAATALGEWHHFYFTSVLCALYVPLCAYWSGALGRLMRAGERSATLRVLSVLAAGELAGAAYVVWLKNTTLARSTSAGGRTYAEAAQFAPSAADLIQAGHVHESIVWAGSQLEPTVYLGGSWLAIFGVCLVAARLRRDAVVPWAILAGHIALAALFAWLALGPSLDRLVPLYRVLYDVLPYWNYGRVPGRMIYIPLCLGSIAFALALTAVLRGPRARWLYGLAGLVVAWDLVARAPALALGRGLPPSAALARLAALEVADGGALLYLPVFGPGSSQNAVWELVTTYVRQPYLNGYSPAAPARANEVMQRLEPLNEGVLDADMDHLLERLGVRYLAYNAAIEFLRPPRRAGDLPDRLRANPRLHPVLEADGWHIFERAAAESPRRATTPPP